MSYFLVVFIYVAYYGSLFSPVEKSKMKLWLGCEVFGAVLSHNFVIKTQNWKIASTNVEIKVLNSGERARI